MLKRKFNYRAKPEVREREKKRRTTTEVRENDRKRKENKRRKQSDVSTVSLMQLQRIEIFKNAIKEGPYYICVICNRCMYRKTVKCFDASKY